MLEKERKPEVNPVLDNSMEREFPAESKSKVVHAFGQPQLDTVLRNVLKRDISWTKQVLNQTFLTLKRMKVQRDLDEAITVVPEGSDHLDLRTLIEWSNSISVEDLDSVEQLVKIDATAKTRVNAQPK